ncbi:M20 family metallo-hydrolase [Nesterenkonia sp. HG001]|uniref:M20 family metallo-hydrolase n=1 Tax=Nesterenkonia sp. HG001 TaxID=2983207 RepID=UPI002AC618A4|nr:M20 family metallo-hydrolase [Nesterenkonia sp. HG001]MDZ5077484.1 M20 family metallo-hydrolase [Nesterenkonia sp. HG001]
MAHLPAAGADSGDPSVRPQDREFLRDFHHTSRYGATPAGGIDRQAGTAEHGQVRRWFEERAGQLGLSVVTDAIGTIYALREWVPGAPFVLVGSHLDSQPRGGRFDGTYGVVAALHAVAAADAAVSVGLLDPRYNVAAVDWFNEEGARFAPSIMGSSVHAGILDLEVALQTTDPQGVTVAQALEATGRRGVDPAPQAAAYAEIHIEQGRRLERSGVPIGIVDRSWHTQKLLVSVIGEQSHTGATLMADRRDALIAASHVVVAVEEVVEEFEPETIVTSVGKFDVQPNSPIVVPRQVDLVVDLRADRASDVDRARGLLLERLQGIARRRDVEIEAQDFDVRPVQRFPADGVELAEKASRDQGVDSTVLATLAGHDSVPMNRIVPSVMLFVPSADGVSHCEREFTSDEDLVTGLRVLTGVVTRLVAGELADTAPGGSDESGGAADDREDGRG